MTTRRLTAWPAVLLGLTFTTGCATALDARREQRVLYTVQAENPGVGLLDVFVPDDVLARAPNDFSNMTGLIAKVMKEYFEERGGMASADSTHLGFKAKWERVNAGHLNAPPYKVANLDGVPVGAQTPLVTVARIVDWRTYTESFNNQVKDVARVQLILSTWTKEGKEVNTELVDAQVSAGNMTLLLKAGDDEMVVLYQESDGRTRFSHQPTRRDELFMAALRAAVQVHYYPYVPHVVSEKYLLADGDALKPGLHAALGGRYEEARAMWEEVYTADPQAHGALFNAAVMLSIRGDDEGAAELLKQARAIRDGMIYQKESASIARRLQMKKTISAAGVESARGTVR
jgi:hypothetical protein